MSLGSALQQSKVVGFHLRERVRAIFRSSSPFHVFLSADARAINHARQAHLASLGLDLHKKKVLEVGAGIGLHTPFFLKRDCEVVITDGRSDNVSEIQRRLPGVEAFVVNVETEADLSYLGNFDIVYCYGLLYHLSNPQQFLSRIAKVCRGQLLLETCVGLGSYAEVNLVKDFPNNNNQATEGRGCRPTRRWLMETLRVEFGHAYATRTQPDHVDFETDWSCPVITYNYRAIFIASKTPLSNPNLLPELPLQQEKFKG